MAYEQTGYTPNMTERTDITVDQRSGTASRIRTHYVRRGVLVGLGTAALGGLAVGTAKADTSVSIPQVHPNPVQHGENVRITVAVVDARHPVSVFYGGSVETELVVYIDGEPEYREDLEFRANTPERFLFSTSRLPGPGRYTIRAETDSDAATYTLEVEGATGVDETDEDDGTDLVIAKEEITGDGADDIRMSNGRIWLQMNDEDLESRTFISALGRDGSDELAGPWQFRPRTHDDHLEFESTRSFDVVEDGDELVAYGVVREYTINDVPCRVAYTVALTADVDAAIVETAWTNLGSETLDFDQPPGHIHDGAMLVRGVELAERSSDYRFHLSDGETYSFDGVRTWRTFDISGEPAFVTVFDDDQAVTYALLEGATGPRHAVTNGRPPDKVDFMVEEVAVAPDETVTYVTAIGAHTGGDDAIDEAEEVVSNADAIELSIDPSQLRQR